jgi:hypothetical protein
METRGAHQVQRAPTAPQVHTDRGARIPAKLGPDTRNVTQHHRCREPGLRQTRLLIQQPRRPGDLQIDTEAQELDNAFRDRCVARLDLTHQRHPARLTQLTRQRKLRTRQRHRCRHSVQTSERRSFAGSGSAHQLFGAPSDLVEIRVLGKYRHDVSSTSGGWPG